MSYAAKAAQEKKDEVKELSKLLKEYPVIALVNVENLPAKQLQVLRGKLRESVLIRMSKKALIVRAIDSLKGSRSGFEQLKGCIVGMPALMFTSQNPFRVAALIRASKSKAPAKPGQAAPYDLVIPAGPTQFTPGPIISELGAAGLKTGVENGKIVIKEDKVVAGKGDQITQKISDLLAKFSIEPMEIGLDLVAAYENGLVYGKDVLSRDPAEYVQMLKAAAAESLGLAIEIGYPTRDNIERMIARAFSAAKSLALQQDILSDVVLERDIATAFMAAGSISSNIPEAEPAEEKRQEQPGQETKG